MKNLLICVFLSLGMISCMTYEKSEDKKECTQQELNVGWTKQYFEHFNNHEWEMMAAIYSETAEFKDPSFGPGIVKQSREETIAKYTELSSIFTDLHDEVVALYPSGDDHVIVEFVSSGTAPDSSTFELPICTIFTFENEKITQDFTYYDNFEENE